MTDEQIKEAASIYKTATSCLPFTHITRHQAFKDGAKWMQSQPNPTVEKLKIKARMETCQSFKPEQP